MIAVFVSLLNGGQADAIPVYETNSIAVPVYKSLLYGEQADASYSPVQHHHQAVHRHHLLQDCSVHLHLLQCKAGAVFEEGWRNSIVIAYDCIGLFYPALEQILITLVLHVVCSSLPATAAADFVQ